MQSKTHLLQARGKEHVEQLAESPMPVPFHSEAAPLHVQSPTA